MKQKPQARIATDWRHTKSITFSSYKKILINIDDLLHKSENRKVEIHRKRKGINTIEYWELVNNHPKKIKQIQSI